MSRAGTQRFGNHYYWVSWLSNEPRLTNNKWDWFNARNYCRKRCMDLVSIETREENEFLKSLMSELWDNGPCRMQQYSRAYSTT